MRRPWLAIALLGTARERDLPSRTAGLVAKKTLRQSVFRET